MKRGTTGQATGAYEIRFRAHQQPPQSGKPTQSGETPQIMSPQSGERPQIMFDSESDL